MTRAYDEPDAVYGLVAHSAELAPDRGSVTFRLRPEAKFADGTPLTADDVVFSFDTLKAKGHPLYPRAAARHHQGRGARRPYRALQLHRHRDARPAAGGGGPADPVQGLLRHARVRSDHARSAAGLGPLQDRELQARRVRQLQAPRRLLGQGPAREPRPLQLRRAALRVLSRPHRRTAGAAGRRVRPARGIHRAATGPPATTSPPSRTGGCSCSRYPTRARPARRAFSSTRAVPSSPTFACARRSTTPSTSSGPTRTSSTISTPAPRASSRTPT